MCTVKYAANALPAQWEVADQIGHDHTVIRCPPFLLNDVWKLYTRGVMPSILVHGRYGSSCDHIARYFIIEIIQYRYLEYLSQLYGLRILSQDPGWKS